MAANRFIPPNSRVFNDPLVGFTQAASSSVIDPDTSDVYFVGIAGPSKPGDNSDWLIPNRTEVIALAEQCEEDWSSGTSVDLLVEEHDQSACIGEIISLFNPTVEGIGVIGHVSRNTSENASRALQRILDGSIQGLSLRTKTFKTPPDWAGKETILGRQLIHLGVVKSPEYDESSWIKHWADNLPEMLLWISTTNYRNNINSLPPKLRMLTDFMNTSFKEQKSPFLHWDSGREARSQIAQLYSDLDPKSGITPEFLQRHFPLINTSLPPGSVVNVITTSHSKGHPAPIRFLMSQLPAATPAAKPTEVLASNKAGLGVPAMPDVLAKPAADAPSGTSTASTPATTPTVPATTPTVPTTATTPTKQDAPAKMDVVAPVPDKSTVADPMDVDVGKQPIQMESLAQFLEENKDEFPDAASLVKVLHAGREQLADKKKQQIAAAEEAKRVELRKANEPAYENLKMQMESLSVKEGLALLEPQALVALDKIVNRDTSIPISATDYQLFNSTVTSASKLGESAREQNLQHRARQAEAARKAAQYTYLVQHASSVGAIPQHTSSVTLPAPAKTGASAAATIVVPAAGPAMSSVTTSASKPLSLEEQIAQHYRLSPMSRAQASTALQSKYAITRTSGIVNPVQ